MANERDAGRGRKFPLTLDQVKKPGAPAKPHELIRPQTLWAAAERERSRLHQPLGLGLDSASVRQRLLVQLQEREGIRHPEVLGAMAQVPRHVFVDTALAQQAYEDTSLPIGLGQTISKPSVVGRMISLLLEGQHPRRHCLEIGTGCGYQAAVLVRLFQRVVSVERLEPLHVRAGQTLSQLGHVAPHLRLYHGDGMLGFPQWGPYDAIISAAGGEDVPAAWLQQLAVGGRLVAPMQVPGLPGQSLLVIDRVAHDQYTRQVLEQVQFVPLKSGVL